MTRWVHVSLVVAVLLTCVLVPQMAVAATTPGGTEVTIEAAENTGATFWHYLTVWGIRSAGVVLGLTGLSKFGGDQRNAGSGVARVGGGVGAQFLPGIINGASTAAPPATGLGLSSAPALSRFLDGLFASSLMIDPVFLAIAGCVCYALWRVHRQRQEDLA